MKKIINLFICIVASGTFVFTQNHAVFLDGSGDYLSAPESPVWDVGTSDFTLSFWITFSDLNRVHDGLFGRNDFQWAAMEYNHDGDHRLNLWIDSNGAYGWNLNNLKPEKNDWIADTWYNIAVIREENTIKILIDGEVAITTSYTQTVYNPTTVPLYFGRSQLPQRTHFGQMDDIRFWSYALSPSEFVSELHTPLTGTEPGLIAYWNFDESSGSTAYDLSPNGNDISLWEDAAFVESTLPMDQVSDLQPFAPVSPTGLPYTIILSDVSIDGISPANGSQISVFDGDLCVGAVLYTGESNLQLVAWQGDDSQGLAGFSPGNPMEFRLRTTWFDELHIFVPDTDFQQGNGDFGYGTFSVVSLSLLTGYSPDISINPTELNYNLVEIGSGVTQLVMIANTGNANLTVNNIQSGSPNFIVQPTTMYLEPGTDDTLSVTFTPTQNMDYNSQITIESDGISGIQTVFVHGTGTLAPVPVISVTPSGLYFGNVSIDTEAYLTLNIQNLGAGGLDISGITSSNPVFSVQASLPATLLQNENMDVDITFHPVDIGQQNGILTINNNDQTIILSMLGYGSAGHFQAVSPTGLPYAIVANDVEIQGFPLEYGDEVAVFDGDLCVGATGITDSYASGALVLDGSGDYISLGNPPELQITGNQTIEMWLYVSDYNDRQNPYAKAFGGEGTITVETNGTVNYYYGTSGGNNSPYQGFTMTSPIPLNTWTHIAIVRDLDNMTLKWYKNGELTNQAGAGFPYAAAGSNTAYIGRGYVRDFHGMIDEVRIWNAPRSQSDIQTGMSSNVSQLTSGLAGYWSFNQLDASDQSLSGNDGILYGDAHFSLDGIPTIPANFQITAWQRDDELGLDGFTIGNEMSFRIWTNVYQTDVELDANTTWAYGDGTFGFEPFTVVGLDADSGLEPDVAIQTQNLYLGQVEVNQSNQETLTLYNNGNAPLHVIFDSITSPFSVYDSDVNILADDSLVTTITFSPTTAGNQTGQLTILCDDPDTPIMTVTLEGFALPMGSPDIGVSVESISFAGVIIDSTSTLSFNVINIGTAPLDVTSISSSNPAFSASPISFTLDNTNDNQEVFVTFTPPSKGLISGMLTINSNGGSRNIYLYGVGYDGHFPSVPPTGLPYTVVVENTNLADYLETGDEIGIFDGDLCVGASPVIPSGGSLALSGGGYLEVLDSPSLDLNGNQLTLEAWVNIESYAGDYRGIVSKIGWSNSSNWSYNMHINDGGGLHFDFVNTGGTSFPVNSPISVGENEWHHVAATYDGTTILLYIDGEIVQSSSANGDIRQNDFNFRIGAWWGSDPNYFNGMIDELRVWNYARTPEQIQSTMMTELSGTESGLMGYWKFTRNGYDSSINENHGTSVGNISWGGDRLNSGIQIIAWQEDESLGLPGFTNGNDMSFRGWTTLNDFQSELNAPAEYIYGNGQFGYGQFSVANLNFDLPDIQVSPESFFFALSTPDSADASFHLMNEGTESLQYMVSVPVDPGMFLAQYFSSPGSGSSPGFGTFVFETEDQFIDSGWGNGGPGNGVGNDDFQVRWTGTIYAENSGSYQFRSYTDDGARLYIDGQTVIDEWHNHGGANYYGYVDLDIGFHDLVFEYYEDGGSSTCYLYWTPPGESESLVPAADPIVWLTVDASSDTLVAGGNLEIPIHLNTTGMVDGLYEKSILILNNTPGNGLVEIPLSLNVTGSSQLVSQQESLQFGEIIVGESDTLSVMLQNIGTDDLTISELMIPDTSGANAYSVQGTENLPMTLSPLSGFIVPVAFSPQTDGLIVDELIVISDAANEDSLHIGLSGTGLTPSDITVSETEWNGQLESGVIEETSFTIYNEGQAPLTFSLQNAISWLSVEPAEGEILVGDSLQILLNVSTIGVYAGEYSGVITILSNDPDTPELSYTLNLTVTGIPEISTPDAVQFGVVPVNLPSEFDFIISNTGTDTLRVDSLAFTGNVFSSAADRAIDAFPVMIPAGDADTLILVFTPLDNISYSEVLTIFSDAQSEPERQVVLQGTGYEPPDIQLSESNIHQTLHSGEEVQSSFDIMNQGQAPLTWSVTMSDPAQTALILDGNGDYISFVNTPSLNPTDAMTIETWLRPSDNSDNFIAAKEQMSAGSYRLWINTNGYYQFMLNGDQSVISQQPAELNTWSHIAAVFTGSEMQIFVNGELDATSSFDPFTIQANSQNLRLGRSYQNQFFQGKMDEFRLWEVARNQSEIQAMMNQSLLGFEPGLDLYLKFDELSGNIAIDSSPNGNDGTYYGNAGRTGSGIPFNEFLTVEPVSGTVNSGGYSSIALTFSGIGFISNLYSQVLTITSNDPDEPEITMPVSMTVVGEGLISASDMELPFSDTYIGITNSLSLTLTNTGAESITIFDWSFSNPDFSVSIPYNTISPLSGREVNIYFSPTSEGAITGTLTIFSNASNESALEISLSGTGVEPPVIMVSPPQLDLSLDAGADSSVALNIANQGGSDLNFAILSEAGLDGGQALQLGGGGWGSIQNPDVFNSPILTVESWIRPDETLSESGTTVFARVDESGNPLLAFRAWAGGTTGGISQSGYELLAGGQSSGQIPYDFLPGQWIHTAVVVTVTAVQVVINGTPVYTMYIPGIDYGNAGDFLVAKDANGNYFSGLIDELRIWNTARSLTELNSFKNQKLTPPITGLVGYFSFDEVGSGDTWVSDESGNGLQMDLSGETDIVLSTAPLVSGNESGLTWLSLIDAEGIVASGNDQDVLIGFNTTGLIYGSYESSLIVSSNDIVNSSVPVPISLFVNAPVALLSEDSLGFGAVSIESSADQSIRMYNTGNRDLIINSIELSDDAFTFDPIPVDFSVLPGDSTEFTVTFAPSQPDVYSAMAIFTTNAGDITATFTGSGYTPLPDIQVDPLELVLSGDENTILDTSFTITNAGEDTLSVNIASSLSWVSFEPVQTEIGMGEILLVDMTVDLNGILPGQYPSSVVIQNNDPDSNPVTIPLTIEVGPLPELTLPVAEYSFSLPAGSWVDTSFVVKNTGAGTLGFHTEESVSWITNFTYADTLASGDSTFVLFSFNTIGLSGGNYSGGINVESNGGDAIFMIDLEVLAPHIVMSTNELNATAMADSITSQSLTVYNTGLTDLEILVSGSLTRILKNDGHPLPLAYEPSREANNRISIVKAGPQTENSLVNRIIHENGLQLSEGSLKYPELANDLSVDRDDFNRIRNLDDFPWLTVDPETATIAAGDSLNLLFTFDASGIAPGTEYGADIFVTHNDTGQQPEPITITFFVNNNISGLTTDDNANNYWQSMPDNDLDSTVCPGDENSPIEFNILITETDITSATLSILAYDVDEEYGEQNDVYLNDVFVGTLAGANNLWSTTVLSVPVEVLLDGWNHVRIDVDVNLTGGCTMVDLAQFIFNTPSSYAGIDDVVLDSNYGYIPGQTMGVARILFTTLPLHEVDIETNILNSDGQIVLGQHEDFIIYSVGVNALNTTIQLPVGMASGTYNLQSILRDTETQTILDMENTPFVVGTPVPELLPAVFDFQSVDVGEDSTAVFTFANSGDLLLTVAAGGLAPPFAVSGIPNQILPQDQVVFAITFTPQIGGIYTDTLSIVTNVNTIQVVVTGYSEEGAISVYPLAISDTLNFGESSLHDLVIRNTGIGNLIYSISGDDPSWVTLSSNNGSIAAADSAIVTVDLTASMEGGDYSTALTISSNDVNIPQVQIPVSLRVNGAQLSFSPDNYEISVNAGESVEQFLYLNNVGSGPLTFDLSTGVPWLTLSHNAGVIDPAESDTISVVFHGDMSAGHYTTNISLTSNDPNQTQVDIPVTFDVWGSTLVMLPSTLNFGHVVIDSTRTLEFTLLNNGNTPAQITAIYSVAPFEPMDITGTVLNPGESIPVSVNFTPAATIFYNENLTIETLEESFVVPLTGIGDAPEPQWWFSWVHHDFDLTDIVTGTEMDLIITNTGNIQIVVDDWDVSSEYFAVSDTTFVLDVGQSITVQVGFYPDAIAVYDGTINWTSNDIGTQELTVQGKGYYLSGAPHLTFVEDSPYNGNSGIYPTLGSTQTYFEYQVLFDDPDGNPPMYGYPKVGIDKNGDGDFLDPSEGEITMQEVNPLDFDYSDGKLYSFITQLPIDQNLGYAFIAYDALGNPATGEGTQYYTGPVISNDLLDLSIFANDITFSDLTPDVGQEVVISATVHNNSDYPSPSLSVRFYEEDLFIQELSISGLSPHSQSTVSIEHVFTIDEFYPIKVVVDEEDNIPEDNEYNNFAIRPVLVGEFSIPGALTSSSDLSTQSVFAYNTLRFFGHADYVNSFDQNSNVSGAEVVMTIHETGATYTGYTNSSGDFDIYFPAPGIVGQYSVSATITDFTLLTTTDTLTFTVIPPYDTEPPTYTVVYGPDLYVHWWMLNWSSDCRIVGEPITVTGWFGNGGNLPAEGIWVDLLQDGNVVDQLYFDYLLPGQTQAFSFTVTYFTPGTHSMGVILDPGNSIAELNEYNNSAGRSRYIYPQEPDLAPVSAWVNDFSPLYGQYVNMTFQVTNFNCTTSGATRAFVYDLYDDESDLIGVLDIAEIAGGSSQYVYLYNYQMMGTGWHQLRIVVDPDNWVVESDEQNQELTLNVYVTQPMAELTISNISVSNYNPVPGDLINFTATIWNNGIDEAESFYVRFKVDGNVLGDAVYVEYLPGTTNMLITSDIWEMADCAHLVEAIVDVDDTVGELNEYNNTVSRTIGVDFIPSFMPYYWYSSISILMGTNLTLFSRIANQGIFGAEEIPVSWILKSSPTSNVDQLLELDIVPYIAGNSYTSSQVVHQFWEPGDYVIEVYADTVFSESSQFCEINENNNAAYLYIHVYEQNPDLEILSYHISPTELNPDPDEPVDIYASFTNNGNVPSGPFWVKFLANSELLGDSVYVQNLGANEDTTVAGTQPFVSDLIGTHVIRVILDDNDQVIEYDESNNEASRAIIVGDAPDLTFSDGGGLWISNPEPDMGELVTLTGVVENNGGATGTAWLSFYTVSGTDTLEISVTQFTAEPYDSLDVTIPWYVTAPYGHLYAEITDSDPPEFNTFNNSVVIEYGARIQLVSPISDIQIPEDTQNYIVADLDTVFTNIDETQLIYEVASSDDHAGISILPGYQLAIDPAANWFGYATITVTANNIYNDSNDDSFILYIWPVNDPPILTDPIPDSYILQDTFEAVLASRLENHFSDADMEDHTVYSAESLAEGLDSLVIRVVTVDSTRLLAYPTMGFTGNIPITVTATDDSLASVNDTLLLSVTSFIYGCTDEEAVNFMPEAHLDDGSCQYLIDIPLTQGWNWFSLNVEAEDMSVNSLLAPLESNGLIIKSQSAFSQFTDLENGWFGSLSELNNTSMFMIKMITPDTMMTTGYQRNGITTPIPLTENWNWISYLPTVPMDIEWAMETVSGTRATLKNQVSFSQFVPQWGFWFGTLLTLEPHDGYKLNMEISDTLVYPVDAPAVAKLRPNIVVNQGLTRGSEPLLVDPFQFDYSATITAAIENPESWMSQPGTILSAFMGDDCRGLASAMNLPGDEGVVFPMLIYSNIREGEEIRFEITNSEGGQTVDVGTRLTFDADMIWGDPVEPMLLTIGDGSGIVPTEYALGQAYPNPFNPVVNLPYSLRDDSHVKITVYDLQGREIAVLVDEFKSAGIYNIYWDARQHASGIYLARMTAGDFTGVLKIALLK